MSSYLTNCQSKDGSSFDSKQICYDKNFRQIITTATRQINSYEHVIGKVHEVRQIDRCIFYLNCRHITTVYTINIRHYTKRKRIKITIVEHIDAVSTIQNTFYGHTIWYSLDMNELEVQKYEVFDSFYMIVWVVPPRTSSECKRK